MYENIILRQQTHAILVLFVKATGKQFLVNDFRLFQRYTLERVNICLKSRRVQTNLIRKLRQLEQARSPYESVHEISNNVVCATSKA